MSRPRRPKEEVTDLRGSLNIFKQKYGEALNRIFELEAELKMWKDLYKKNIRPKSNMMDSQIITIEKSEEKKEMIEIYHGDNNFKCLIDKKIFSMSLSDDKEIMTLKTQNSLITLTAQGDCCSHSWIEHYDAIPEGTIIKSVITKDVRVLKEDEDYDLLQQYFYEIITDKGCFTIELRNSSNGYYGGYLEVYEKPLENGA